MNKKKENLSRQQLLQYLEKDKIKKILEAFTFSTGIMANIVDTKGISIYSQQDFGKCCEFCQIIYNCQDGLSYCRKAYKTAGLQDFQNREPFIFQCHAGLIEWAAALISNEIHLGSVICGQVLLWEPEKYLYQEIIDLNKNKVDNIDALINAINDLPIIAEKTVRESSYFLALIVNELLQKGYEIEEYKKQLSDLQNTKSI